MATLSLCREITWNFDDIELQGKNTFRKYVTFNKYNLIFKFVANREGDTSYDSLVRDLY